MEIKITRKRIKNIIIRINEDGEVLISAPLKIPKSYIENLLKEKEEWIREKIASVQRRKERVSTYDEGEKFLYLGKEYTIEVKRDLQEGCQLLEDRFIISLKENSLEIRKRLIDKWICENFYPYIIELTMRFGERMGFPPRVIKFRDMKTRWGSCNTLTRSITYNHKLYSKPLEILEYIVVHELSHIPFPHHQKSFWNFVEKYIPDWKERRKLLKELKDE